MLPTPEEKRRQALLEARKEKALSTVQARQNQVNPLYGTNPFEPSSYIPTVPADPKLAQPLPSGRYIDPRIPSGAAAARAAEIDQFRDDPRSYVQENIAELNNEQSLIDKSLSFLGRVFNYNDPADLQVFGVNLSAVESTWDGFMRYFTGAYDLLSIGFGGLLSAAPGGIQTLSYEELSGGKSVGQVLSGEMEQGTAPSPGQIAIASIAAEAKRIREGGARLSDVLLLNPATAPFILAALAAESSPLQQDGFNIMDDEQRKAAFSQGYEQWFSGITDAGLMFADPLIGVGVAAKVTRAGLLGRPGNINYGNAMAAATRGALDELDAVVPGSSGKDSLEILITRGQQLNAEPDSNKSILARIAEDPEYTPVAADLLETPPIRASAGRPDYKNPIAQMLHQLHEVDDEGNRVLEFAEFVENPNFKDLNNRADVASILWDTRTPAETSLVLEVMSGTAGADARLAAYKPGLADAVFRYKAEHYQALVLTNPDAVKTVSDGLNALIDNTRSQLNSITEQINRLSGGEGVTTDPQIFESIQVLRKRQETLQQTLDESVELWQVATGEKTVDLLDPTNPFYNKDRADRIIADLHSRKDAVTRAINQSIADSAKVTQTFLPVNANPYARMVMASRERRGRAAYQYSAEGTSILPHKKTVIDENGKAVVKWDGWLSPSSFEGVSRFQRNARVWRWLGTETPAGYIGLKGTATVGSEREFTAALSTELYGGDGLTVTRKLYNADGTPRYVRREGPGQQPLIHAEETVTIGGRAKRDEYFRRFYEALNNPDMDALQTLKQIEEDIITDYAAAYGIDADEMKKLLKKADKARESNLELIRDQAFFVDQNGDMQHVPYLDSQLATGTYMHNFGALEKILKREIQKDNGESLRRSFEIPAHFAGSAYTLFNDFWRPATLLRFSYTQRNIFEGLVRAMAYSASLAPLLWPIKATAFGVRNQVVKKNMERRLTVAAKKIKESDFNQYLQEYNAASVDEWYLRAALKMVQEGDSEPMMYVTNGAGETTRLTEAEWETALDAAMRRTTDAYASVKGNKDAYDEALKGTAFGKWREKNIKDLRQNEVATLHQLALIQNNAYDAMRAGDAAVMDDTLLAKTSELVRVAALQRQQLDILEFDPIRGTELYRSVAGRQKRIGSGKSIGPDGNFHGDAFTGPLEQINRRLMSSDLTIMQTLSLQADAWSSPFYKTLIRNNQPVAFSEKNIDAWAEGMRASIEEASSSWLVRSLVKNGWDEDKVLAEMMGTREGQQFLVRIASLSGDASLEDVARTVDDAYIGTPGPDGVVPMSARTNIRRFSEMTEDQPRTPGGERLGGVTDPDQARVYINETANMVKRQMQSRADFIRLLEQRAREKMGEAPVVTGGVTVEQIKAIIDLMPEADRARLRYIQGAEIVQMGADNFLGVWASLTAKFFKYLGQLPEDAVTRGGFYNMRFKAYRNDLIKTYLVRTGQQDKLRKGRRARTAGNREHNMSIDHDEFEIPQAELMRIMQQSHRAALKDTREWMYTIERRTKLGKYGEWIYPFISATQNTATVAGKLLYKEPWLAPMVTDIWRMPTRLGIEDEEGNLLIPMPFEFIGKWLEDKPYIPVIGGVVSEGDVLRIPKGGLNVWIPETGYGVVPRPSPWVQIGASELMKANMFPSETPQPVKALLGEQNADEVYNALKDYVFGEDQGPSPVLLSLDKIAPGYLQRILQSRDELAKQYGYQYSAHYHTQMMRFRAGERDEEPTVDEINKRTTNSMWFAVFGSQGIPTPLTPYPIITRPQVDSPVAVLQDVYRKLQQADPLNANLNMDRLFGDWALEAAQTKVMQGVGGANPNANTISDIDTLAPLIREIAPSLGENDLGVLGILINNRRPAEEYEQASYQMLQAKTIPGTNRQWSEVQSPQQANAERQRIVGWTIYRKAIDQLDAQLRAAGLSSYEVKAAAPFKAAKERLRDNLLSNPDMEGWIVDYQDASGTKTLSAVRLIERAVQDKTFQNLLIKSGKERLLGIMQEYTYARQLLLKALDARGGSLENEDNIMLKVAWDTLRVKWRGQDERWAEIDSLYLSGDDNPRSPGNLGIVANLENQQGVMP